MSDGIITLVGNVASDVRTIKSERGTAITSFRFAHTPRRIDRQTGRWGDGPTSFYGVTCWRSLAEHCRGAAQGRPHRPLREVADQRLAHRGRSAWP